MLKKTNQFIYKIAARETVSGFLTVRVFFVASCGMFGRPSMTIFCVRQISVRIYFLALDRSVLGECLMSVLVT
jgi:hypothetical protein